MNAGNPRSRVLFLAAVFLFALAGTSAYGQKTGELPRTPGLGSPTPGRVLTTPDFKLPTQDKGGVERSAPIIREGIEEQRKGLEPGGPSLREPLPAMLAPLTREPIQPKGDRLSPYWERERSRWDWESVMRDTRRAYAIEVLMKEIEGKGEGQTKKNPEGYFYDGTYYADDLPKWRATQDGFLDRLRTLPKPVLQSAVARVGIEAIRPPPTRFGPGGALFNKPDLPPGGLTDHKDSDGPAGKEENPYIVDEGKWDITRITKDIMKARAVAGALADIRDQGYSTNPDMTSAFGEPIFAGEGDLATLEGLQISIEYLLEKVPLDIYGKAWNEANRIEDEKDDLKRKNEILRGFDPRPDGNGTMKNPTPFGEGPSPGPQRPPQKGVIAGQGGGGGGSSIGPNPGQGGVLVGGGGGQQGGGLVAGGYSQGGGSQAGGGGSLGEPGGARGGEGTPGTPGGTGDSKKGPDKGGDWKDPKKDGETTKKGDDKGGSSGSEVKKTDDGKKGSSSSSDSSGSSRSQRGKREPVFNEDEDSQQTIDITPDLPADPETRRGRGGGEDLRGRIATHRPRGVTNQQADLVGPAFRKTTGADDKERPVTGGTSGSVSTNPSESRADDVGGLHVVRTGGGGEAGSALEALLRKLGLWEKWQAGGPDPPK